MNPMSLTCLGWSGRLSADYQHHDRPDHWPARVSRVEPGVCTVIGSAGVRRASLAGRMLAVAVRDAGRLPCPGDWVVVRTWPDERSTVEAVLPRRGVVWRTPGPGAAASNVDFMMRVDDLAGTDPDLVGALRALAAPGRTLGLVGADPRPRSAVVAALAGGTVLPPLAGALVPLPGGGAVIDLVGPPAGASAPHRVDGAAAGRVEASPGVSIYWDDIDASPTRTPLAVASTCTDAR